METLDAPRQSLGLPPINSLDADKVKREEMDAYPRKHSAPMVSPLHSFPSHSYSSHQSTPASSGPAALSGLLSPPESRRTSGNDEKEREPRPMARQSLPSIHEALGAAPVSAPPPFQTGPSAASPSEQRGRAFSADVHASQGPPNPFSHPRSPFLAHPSSAAPPPPPPPAPADPLSRPAFSTPQHNSKLPQLHPLRTTQSPPPPSSRSFNSYSSQHEAHSAGSMNQNYGYSQYPPNYPLSAPPPSAPPNNVYPPYSAPPRYPPPSWRDNPEDQKPIRSNLAPYGESVKRHLENFDLEASLNEMADGAGRIVDFSKEYRGQAHSYQRIGLTPKTMPRLEVVDEMLKQSEKIQMSLQRMRDVVYNHHQANVIEPPRDQSHYRPVNGYDHEGPNSYSDDMKGNGGFAGPDPKKQRRGQRAAPPGRCHSCNRAETPEWRRGPDGARTLCNACGLHYAKLTRKMGGKNAMTSSNLRPKSISDGSPAA